MQYVQTTYVNGEQKYGPTVRTPDEMVALLARVLVLKEEGFDYRFVRHTDASYETTGFTVDFTTRHDRHVHQEFKITA